jgi:hypothetical protein
MQTGLYHNLYDTHNPSLLLGEAHSSASAQKLRAFDRVDRVTMPQVTKKLATFVSYYMRVYKRENPTFQESKKAYER